MCGRAAELIALLDLRPHPEGGRYREWFRSPARVRPDDDRGSRSALTTIYFLLVAGDVSRWHRVTSDEVWHYHEGDALELLVADESGAHVTRHVLGSIAGPVRSVHAVPARHWQAARPTGEYTLVSCDVGPGFDFADFEMLRDRPDTATELRRRHSHLASLL
jgi:predicted cupin superfamily sugar epimerase